MASLSTHLRQPNGHGHLPFHPDCPVCRSERLAGALASDPVVTRRAQAALVAGMLAASTGAPVAAAAAETDQQSEGTVPQGQTEGLDPARSPDFDPGGESTDLPFNAPATPQVPATPDPHTGETGALEQEPSRDIDAPIADPGDEPTEPTGAPPGPIGPPQTPAPQAGTPAVEPPAATPPRETSRERAEEKQPDRESKPSSPRPTAAHPDSTVSPPASAEAIAPPTVVRDQAASTAPEIAAPEAQGHAAERGDRLHVVLPGESLWSIAEDLVGEGASVARIAREVNRLWQLNGERIGTGNPDLLMAGTNLVLR